MRARAFHILMILVFPAYLMIAPETALAAVAKTRAHPVAVKAAKARLPEAKLSHAALRSNSHLAAHWDERSARHLAGRSVAHGDLLRNERSEANARLHREATAVVESKAGVKPRHFVATVHPAAPVQDDEATDPEVARVRHNPKVHHSEADEAQPRKAAATDFLPDAAPGAGTAAVPPVRPVGLPVRRREIVPEPPTPVPVVYRRGKLVVPPALKGSHEILLHQNEMADKDGLARVQDDEDLENLRASGMLVAIPVAQGLRADERLPANRRYCRPWTAQFLAALARAHYARFHTPLQVNSAVRTVEFQQRLLLTNGNAAPAEGETASPHLTGQAVDLAKKGLSLTEIAWLRGYLLPLVQDGKVDVEEEFQQACFHISVYRKYVPQQSAPKKEIAGAHRSATSALAAVVR